MMRQPGSIEIEQYRYTLPESRIARYPLPQRDQSSLLLYDRGRIEKHTFRELPDIIPAGTRLAFNTTRVIQARLKFQKQTGARIEIFCLEPVMPADYEQAFQATSGCSWKCLIGNARKWKEGPVHLVLRSREQAVQITAEMERSLPGAFIIRFSWDHPEVTFGAVLEQAGQTPIPPYLNREAEESDRYRYQTVYGRNPGSVAAPTAGLHFSGEMMNRLQARDIRTSEITLHVGTGTFVPVKEDDARKHTMHAELVVISRDFLEGWLRSPEPLLAVGTTTTRSLESLYWLGVKLGSGEQLHPDALGLDQWENETLPEQYSLRDSLVALQGFCQQHLLEELVFATRLMIVPGYRFRAIHGLITNFHMPGSTLLLLIAAFIGEEWRKVYDFALSNQFRFLSYGDSSLLLPNGWSGAH
jgi:S-adenosylmethionine:tRNA ribosyltransferase-isomerase